MAAILFQPQCGNDDDSRPVAIITQPSNTRATKCVWFIGRCNVNSWQKLTDN